MNRTFDTGKTGIQFLRNTENSNWYQCKVYPNGGKYYFDRNKAYHRLDGPAIIYPSGNTLWYVNGHNVTGWVSNWLAERGLNMDTITGEDWIVFQTEMRLLK